MTKVYLFCINGGKTKWGERVGMGEYPHQLSEYLCSWTTVSKKIKFLQTECQMAMTVDRLCLMDITLSGKTGRINVAYAVLEWQCSEDCILKALTSYNMSGVSGGKPALLFKSGNNSAETQNIYC